MIYLLVKKVRGSITISSMIYFNSIESLIEHMRNISYKKIYYAYRLLPGKEGGELISNKELKELGLT